MEYDNNKVKIIVATHKKYEMPLDFMYLPLHVGAEKGEEIDLGYMKDNTGDNISDKNPSFCELTGLYWAWKNLNTEYIGLAHYRRHFVGNKKEEMLFDRVLPYRELKPLLDKYQIFVPRKRRYYIESLYSHYKHTHYAEQLDKTREIISVKYPEYLEVYDCVLKRSHGYMFNMMIMQRNWLDRYCSWLFDILFELEKQIDMPELSAYQARFYGRISEIIFNVWLEYQISNGRLKQDQIKEVPYMHMEKIDWWTKGTSFLKSKFLNRRYEGSF